METGLLERFRDTLSRRREQVTTWLNGAMEEKQGNGANGAAAGLHVVSEIDHALACLDEGSFGRCALCEGEVEPARLEMDFTLCVCLDHYSETQKRALERDLEMAAQVHQQLFPRCVPALPGLTFAAHAQPAHIVGGDYYDFFPYCDNMQGALVADVMGKGLPASMLMSNMQAALRILGPQHDAPHALAGRLNEVFRHNLGPIRFVTLFLLALDVEQRRLHYCNAGHNPALWWQASAHQVHWLRPTGPALGLLPDPLFLTETISFEKGDLILLYTDGLVETRNLRGEAFGEERLARFVALHHGASAESLLSRLWSMVERFSGGRIDDDVALLIVRA